MNAPDPLSSQRHLFDLPAEVAYLNCAYMAPQLRSVTEAGLAVVPRKARPWERSVPEGWFANPEALRAAVARVMGAAFVVDASQSLGAHPLDVAEVRPDFLASVTYKWLLGPYELAYLYVGPRWRDGGRPIEASWLARADAEDFTGLVDYTDAYADGARRFDMGGYPQFILGSMALAAVNQVLDWGVERIRATIAPLTRAIADGARALGCEALEEGKRVGHMVGVRLPGGVPPDLVHRLEEARIYVSVRGDAIRISPHLYNDEADVERLLEVVRAAL